MKIESLSKSFRSNLVLNNIFLDISRGIYRLDGKNGSGKSTLIRLLSGMDKFDDGTRMNLQENILYLDSDPLGLYPLTIKENIELLWKTFAVDPTDEQKEKVIRFFGGTIEDFYSSASTGTKAKLGLSLIFVKHWDYIFMDETMSPLDSSSINMIACELVSNFQESLTIYVFHNLNNSTLEKNSKTLLLDGGSIFEK
ncbi:MAG: ATP-binding cassette domain-containing protein [Lactobacillales bacterium]|jgi:ABC-2 type transport system ATP-binding protein|nr:ATP-binding cassette domain-containing protein [Lactobacillales bacterium]